MSSAAPVNGQGISKPDCLPVDQTDGHPMHSAMGGFSVYDGSGGKRGKDPGVGQSEGKTEFIQGQKKKADSQVQNKGHSRQSRK